MSYASAFSADYFQARDRFRSLASNAQLFAYPIESMGQQGETLTIDVAKLGAQSPQKIVLVSSGIHGVEGFFGSAVQIALLEKTLNSSSLPPGLALVLVHSLNPYGFAWRRRTNEDNIDLNRNFLLPGEKYQGSPERYGDLNDFFNPTSVPSPYEPFLIKGILVILRYGIKTLKNTLPVGQYDYPKGLFYGGSQPSQTYQILDAHLREWIGNAQDVVHLDLHTGLGRKGTYKLLIEESEKSQRTQWLKQKFGPDVLEILNPKGTAYYVRGSLGKWCQSKLPQCNYIFLTAEFGTYSIWRGIKVLRAENCAYFWSQNRQAYNWTIEELMEFAAPQDRAWRSSVVSQGLDLVKRAIDVCLEI